MSYYGDKLIRSEESNWNDLAEKFIKKHQDLWDDFVYNEYDWNLGHQEPEENR